MGGGSPILGIAAFLFVKVVGYRAFLGFVNRRLGTNANVTYAAIAKIILGCVGHLLVVYIFRPELPSLEYFTVRSIARLVEWWAVIYFMFEPWKVNEKASYGRWVVAGVLVSLVLDAPAVLGFLAFVPFWMC